MRPLGSSGLTSFSGRSFTVPVMRSTHSARASCAVAWARSACAGLSTTCTLPVSSRRSMKTSLPWSRRACTQPATVTVSPIAFGRFLIHVLALIRTDAEQYIVNFLNTIVVSTIYRFAYIVVGLERRIELLGVACCNPLFKSPRLVEAEDGCCELVLRDVASTLLITLPRLSLKWPRH